MKASRKVILLVAIILLVVLFFAFDLGRFFSLDYIVEQRDVLQQEVDQHPGISGIIFFLIYVAVTGLSLPGAAVMTVLGGALFGLFFGLVLVSFASAIGATLAFLASRVLFRDTVQRRFGDSLRTVNKGVEQDGSFYLFGLRLVPLFPFFVINLVMGLTPMKTLRFYWVSQLGMLPGTIVYVNAGTQLGQVDSLGGILSPQLIGSFVLLAIFPIIARSIMNLIKRRRLLKNYSRPDAFDRNLIVIGAGSAGLVTAYIAAATKASVTLIEKHKMGGDCLNTGCVPSKTLIKSARIAHDARRGGQFGVETLGVNVDFPAVMERVQSVIKTIEPHDSIERYTSLGVDCVTGEARIVDPWRVEVDGKTLTTRNIVIATGARPFVPPIPGIDLVPYYTSDTVWELRQAPKNLLILGGGPIGCELAQAFARLDVPVVQIDQAPRILSREDDDAAQLVTGSLVADGVDLRTGARAERFEKDGDSYRLIYQQDGEEKQVEFDTLLLAVGRKANTESLGLEALGIETNDNGTLQVDETLQTRIPGIYACGDVAGPYQFTHAAAHQAWYASVNSLFGSFKTFKVDYRVLPWTTFTDPEVARVGLNEQEAKEQGVAFEVTTYSLDELDRAIAEGETEGFVKVLTPPGKDRILGATVVGNHAGELITEFISAMKHGYGLNKILGTIHVYPTLSEANKFAAGNWKKAHAPESALRWLERFHAWRRA
ncbi:bifunctional TVP38/TMEM64 family protein/FAD-dependent oxidoreductase [Marinobacter nanhaiticus D15-8W]|uniref:Pyridine nucleotide-disulfide oxidoreductase n=1 Tax=Marinobacter nanhaiticus D15-8W TaxID=626887 RepID=N6X3L2_9GAMM|nr:FAD-dependent oxidoreductase [Marinobacter nanhaiticus]ENO15648.1 pyridine nucleotide-disulfide oxidoreductase [Marinobacter nanhaiticus D15-8W]BES73501.1 bifunctional TVP38/TMEM64 family protein/FAD-dependent oxidoreductase [Marinobacter nanhaiticus D15-8W]